MHNASISNMKTLTLKNVPDETYARIGRVAKANSRSLNRQAILLLERASCDESEVDLDAELAELEEFRRGLGFTARDADITQAKHEGRP